MENTYLCTRFSIQVLMSRHRPFITFLAFILICINAMTAAAQEQQVNIIILGDSNIWLAGDSCNNHTGWTSWMKDILQPRSCISYARSGASWSHTSQTKCNTKENIAVLGDDNVIYNQVMRLREAKANGSLQAPDLILISSGGNDAWFSNKRPLEFNETVEQAFNDPVACLLAKKPNEVTSLSGAIRYDCLLLKETFPDAKIVLVTPTPMVKVEPDMLLRVSDIIEQSGRRLGISTLRLDKAELISRETELKEHVNTYDGIHTNERGAQKVGTYVAGKIRAMLNADSNCRNMKAGTNCECKKQQ